ncbi:hypothetical protein L0Y40_02055 [Candidatus Wolfebacteria bacterium]|nr:hypothetical protein [Candidatus Wolfebacteria bacterium]
METLIGYAISPTALWIVLAIVFGAWLVVSWILSYHWHTYTKGSHAIRRVMVIYFGVSLVIFITEALLIISIS